MSTTTQDLLLLHDVMTSAARKLMEAKNHDYANAAQNDGGAFSNFMLAERLGLCSTEKGMMVRLTDKIARMSTLLSREAMVHDEQIEDTVLDIINYAILILAYVHHKEGQAPR